MCLNRVEHNNAKEKKKKNSPDAFSSILCAPTHKTNNITRDDVELAAKRDRKRIVDLKTLESPLMTM